MRAHVSRNSKISFSVLTSAPKIPTQASTVHSLLHAGDKAGSNDFTDLPGDAVLKFLAGKKPARHNSAGLNTSWLSSEERGALQTQTDTCSSQLTRIPAA